MPLPKINEINTTTVKIPSSGTEIEIRPYYVKEERELLNMSPTQKTVEMFKAILNLISSCVQTEGFNAHTLTQFDIEYLFLKLRSISVGETVEIGLTCQNKECEHTQKTKIDLSDVEVYFNEEHTNKIKLTDDVVVEMAYPDPIKTATMIDNTPNQEELMFSSIEMCISKVYQGDTIYENFTDREVTEFVNSLTQDQFTKLASFVQTSPTIQSKLELTCPKCGRDNEYIFEGMNDFFTLG